MDTVHHRQILQELSAREPIFHRRAFGTSRAALEQMTAPDFHEIGASGRRYDRSYAIETMLARYAAGPEPHDWPCHDFALHPLAEGLYLITYTLTEPGRTTRRSTIWRQTGTDWQIVFHQGTPIEAPAGDP